MPPNLAKPAVESMEVRALLSAVPAEVAVLNPGIADISSDGSSGIDATNPGTISFVVLSQANPTSFDPLDALVPRTIRVDGVAVHVVSVRPDPIDVNGDGIADAVVTVRTDGALSLPPGPGVLIVAGTTRLRDGRTAVAWASAAAVNVPAPVTVLPTGPNGASEGYNPNPGGTGVGEGSGLGVGGTSFALYNGYINIINDTSINVYDSLLVNTPPGGNPAPYPGTYVRLVPHQTLQVYTGPGTVDQLAITANFSSSPSGSSPFYAVWYAGHMTLVNTFPVPPVVNWYLHQNPSGQFYFNNKP